MLSASNKSKLTVSNDFLSSLNRKDAFNIGGKNYHIKTPVEICLCLVLGLTKDKDRKTRKEHLDHFFDEVDAITKDLMDTAFGPLLQVRTIPIVKFPEMCKVGNQSLDVATFLANQIRNMSKYYGAAQVILHFVCHGKNNGAGLLCDAEPNKCVDFKCMTSVLQYLDMEEYKTKINGIIFSACDTDSFAQNLSSARMRFTIGHRGLLLVTSANVFANEFYVQLCNGQSPKSACESASKKAKAQQEKDACRACAQFRKRHNSDDQFRIYGKTDDVMFTTPLAEYKNRSEYDCNENSDDWHCSSTRIELFNDDMDEVIRNLKL